jgi:transcriptional repressor NrdR
LVVKKDGRREPFDKDKLLRGIQAACQKRPVSIAQMEQTVEKITKWVLDRCEREVSSDTIGQNVMSEIRMIDNVAYIRFASVYRTFKDVYEFVEGLKPESSQLSTEPLDSRISQQAIENLATVQQKDH